MTVPPSVDTRVVQGTYVDGAGVARQGTVTFRVDQPLIAEVESWGIVPTPIVVQLDGSGHFSVSLMASDDLNLFPSGFRWIVQERFQGGYVRTYSFELPSDAEPFDLPTATQYDPGDVGLAVVHSVNGRTGIVQFTSADFDAIPLSQKGVANGVATLNSGGVIPPEQLSPGYLLKTNNLSDVNSVSTSRNNLGLGTAATHDVGWSPGQVILGDDTRLSNARTPIAHALTHSGAGSDPIVPASIGASAVGHVHAGTDITTATVAYARLPVGTVANTVTAGDDARLSDQRVPVDASVTAVKIGAGAVTTIKIGDAQVTTVKIADGAVLTAKIADAQVVTAKLGDASVTTVKIGDAQVTSAKIADGTIVNADISPSAAIALTKLGTDPLARANHTGTQLAATISDLGTAATRNTGTGATNVILGNDARLTDARTPVAHAASHASAGSDPVTPAAIGADPAGTATTAVTTHTGAVDPHGDRAYADTSKLSKASNLSDVNSVSTSRTNLGLGTAATADTGTGPTNVVLGNDARLTDSRPPGVHASTHATGGSDPVTPASIGASAPGHVHTGTDITTGTVAYGRLPVGTAVNTVAAGDDTRFTDQRTPLDDSVTSAKIVNGTIVDADISGSAAIANTKLATNPLARANHTGTQLASTVSDFATAVATTAALKANNLSDLVSAPTSRTNLGLGGAAVLNVGTGAGTVAAGDDARLTDARAPLAGTVVNASVSASAAIALSKLATDPLARANHTGTQTSSTISDFTTASRTALAGTSPWINVRDYGAVCDGTTDDLAAINAAIAACPSDGIVQLFQNHAVTGPITVPPHVTLRGIHGGHAAATIVKPTLKPKSSFTGTAIILMVDQTTGGYAVSSGEQRLENLSIDCSNITVGQATDGIQIQGDVSSIWMIDVQIRYARRDGLRRVTNGSGSPQNFHVTRLHIASTGGIGIDASCHDSLWTNCEVLGAGTDGWVVNGAANTVWTNCRSEWAGGHGWNVGGDTGNFQGSGGFQFIGCATDRSALNGFYITAVGAAPISISGGMFRRDGASSTSSGYAAIRVNGALAPILITGITIYPGVQDDGGGNNSPQYGLSFTNVGTVSYGECMIHAASAGVFDGGGNTVLLRGANVRERFGTMASFTTVERGLQSRIGGISTDGTMTATGGTWNGSPTIVTPTIASFTNAQHDHSTAAQGGFELLPRCNIRRDATFTSGTGVDSTVTLDTSAYQVGGTWWGAGTPTVITIPANGDYMISLLVVFQSAGVNGGMRVGQVKRQDGVNSVDASTAGPGGSAGDWVPLCATMVARLTAGNTYTVHVNQSSGSTMTIFQVTVAFTMLARY